MVNRWFSIHPWPPFVTSPVIALQRGVVFGVAVREKIGALMALGESKRGFQILGHRCRDDFRIGNQKAIQGTPAGYGPECDGRLIEKAIALARFADNVPKMGTGNQPDISPRI